MEIKVLGSGCAKCKKTEDLIKQVVNEAKIEARVEKVTDLMEIAGYGVFGTPAIVIDGQVKSVGKIPTKQEILNWINS
ncbi:MAG: thioredoxin family protein [Desulfobacterium sp.]|jgi:small redox-active disulfide protein 2|nr:thioredoxin family protein [Desulfobacterium sp.]